MHPGSQRAPFNPAGPFVARHRVLLGGWYNAGEPIPVNATSERRFKQLHENFKVDVCTEEEIKRAKVKKLLPANWRMLVNRELFPMISEATGIFPKNRMEAFEVVEKHGLA